MITDMKFVVERAGEGYLLKWIDPFSKKELIFYDNNKLGIGNKITEILNQML